MSSLPIHRLFDRALGAHKGEFGHALLIGGSPGMAGSIALAAMAALRGGAGLVTAAVPASQQALVASWHPCMMTLGLPESETHQIAADALVPLLQLAAKGRVVAIGPGMGRTDDSQSVVQALYQLEHLPMVLDADAIPEGCPKWLTRRTSDRPVMDRPAARIWTPHPGEFERWSGVRRTNRRALEQAARELAEMLGVVILLKGHRSLVTDGNHAEHNPTGCPEMAAGGAGDCLTGLLAALLAQGLPAWDAARLGAYLHGLAGQLAARRLGGPSVLATDIIESLPTAFRQLRSPQDTDASLGPP
ncbi:MAG: NAD(P)H-hydrate dehydratase [Pirellulaceae bacterium]